MGIQQETLIPRPLLHDLLPLTGLQHALHRVLFHFIGVMLRHGPSELVLLLPGQLDSREEATCQPCSLSSSFSLAPSPSFRSTQYLTSPSSPALVLEVGRRAAATGLWEDHKIIVPTGCWRRRLL